MLHTCSLADGFDGSGESALCIFMCVYSPVSKKLGTWPISCMCLSCASFILPEIRVNSRFVTASISKGTLEDLNFVLELFQAELDAKLGGIFSLIQEHP